MKLLVTGIVARSARAASLALVPLVAACGMRLGEAGQPSARRSDYQRELRASHHAAADWIEAGLRALPNALRVARPFEERVLFDDGLHSAVAYRFELRRGEKVHVNVDPPRLRRGGVFIEAFRIVDGVAREAGAAKRGAHALTLHAREAGIYVVRVQPERTHAGLYRISIPGGSIAYAPAEPGRTSAGLLFPVAGRDAGAIRSGFGDPRDGGRRSHRGVDIFAPRGTLALAAADGVVIDAGFTAIGGRIVWLAAHGLGLDFYYAHLDEHMVRRGQRVRAGDPIGRVGNTGNAAGTPPHLHFGVYRPGGRIALDPAAYLSGATSSTIRLAGRTTRVEVDVGALGAWQRAASAGARLRTGPDASARVVAELPAHTPVRLLGASRSWYRVLRPDGVVGFASALELEAADALLESEQIRAARTLREEPWPGSAVLATLEPGTRVALLGSFEGYRFVRLPDGLTGWIED